MVARNAANVAVACAAIRSASLVFVVYMRPTPFDLWQGSAQRLLCCNHTVRRSSGFSPLSRWTRHARESLPG